MPATTDAAATGRTPTGALTPLRHRAPGWLVPTMAALALAEAAAIVAQAALVAGVVHRVLVAGDTVSAAAMPMLVLLAVLAGRAGLSGLREWLAAGASARVRLDLRDHLAGRLLEAAPHPDRGTGRLATACVEQVEALDGFYSRYLPQATAALLIPPVVLAAVFSRDGVAGLVLLLAGPLIPVFMALIGLGTERLSREQHAAMARLGGWFSDRLRGAETLRLFRAEAAEITRVAGMTDALRRHAMRVLRVAFLSSAVLEFLSAVAIASLAIYIGLGLLGMIGFAGAGDMTLFTGLFVLLLAPEYFQPIRTLSQGWHDRAGARGALAELEPLLALPPARTAPAAPRPLPATSALAVRLERVAFAHLGRGELFTDLDLTVAAGERLVLTGPSGGGKSTLLQLIAGSLAPTAGRIRLGGVDLADVPDAGLVAHIGWLDQRPVLFAGTLADNLRLAAPGASTEELERAARRAGVSAFADLDQHVDEDGHGLSGGQIQRIALARTLLRPHPLLLLDEPTASLDPATEADVLAALADWLAGHPATVICASHRPALMPWADRVLAVRDGRLEPVA